MAGDGVAGILEAGIALHHRFGEISNQGEDRDHRSEQAPHQRTPVPTKPDAPHGSHKQRGHHAAESPLNGLTR